MEHVDVNPNLVKNNNFNTDKIAFTIAILGLIACALIFFITQPTLETYSELTINEQQKLQSSTQRNNYIIGFFGLVCVGVIAYYFIKNRQSESRTTYLKALLPEVYVPRILKWFHKMSVWNPDYAGSYRYLDNEPKPVDLDYGIPREVDFYFVKKNEVTKAWDIPIAVRLSAEHDFYVIGCKFDYLGKEGLLFNQLGLRRFADIKQISPNYTVTLKNKAGITSKPEENVEDEEVDDVE